MPHVPEYFPDKLSATEYQRLALITAQSDVIQNTSTMDEFLTGTYNPAAFAINPAQNAIRSTMTAGGQKSKYNLANYTSSSTTNADSAQNPPSSAVGLNPYGVPSLNIGSRGIMTNNTSRNEK